MAGARQRAIWVVSPDAVYGAALRRALEPRPTCVVPSLHELPSLETPDVVVVLTEDGAGLEALAAIPDGVPFLVLGPEDEELLLMALESGAAGYVVSDAPFEEVTGGIEAVAGGQAVVPPTMLGTLLRHVVRRRRAEGRLLESLSNREREVFELARQGMGKDEIARRLYISPATARTHLERVYRKLDVHSHAELVALAAQVETGGSR